MNDDFESRLARVLNEQVDARLGQRQAAPPFEPARPVDRSVGTRRRSARPWIIPLVAAAAVVVVAAGALGVSRLAADKNSPASTQTPPTPTPSKTVGRTVLDGASIPLPPGWVARDYVRYDPAAGQGATSGPSEGWCLTPASTPVTVGVCPLWLRAFVPSVGDGPMMDVDNREGAYGNPHQVCIPSGVTHRSEQAAERTFGGRAAEWRQWRDDCASGAPFRAEQYVVPTAPAYILFSEHVDATVHRVMTDLATHASLPPATSGLRYEDYGLVRRIRVVADGVRISIDRKVRDQAADADHTTYDYVVPNKVYVQAAATLKVGRPAQVFTDGTRVILVYGFGT